MPSNWQTASASGSLLWQDDSSVGKTASGGVDGVFELLCSPATGRRPVAAISHCCSAVVLPASPGVALSGVCLEAGRNWRLALRHDGQTQRGRVVCGRLALRSTFTLARLRRGSRLRWRRSVRRRPTERAVRQLPQQQARQRDAQRGNRVWVMPLGTDPATRAGGSLPPARRQRIQDDRRGQRGKNGSARLPGTHKPQCTA